MLNDDFMSLTDPEPHAECLSVGFSLSSSMGVILLGFQAFGSLGALGTFDRSFSSLRWTRSCTRCYSLAHFDALFFLAHFDALLLQILDILSFWASPELEALAV